MIDRVQQDPRGLEDLQLALHALEALPYNETAAKQTLGGLCEAHGLHTVRAYRTEPARLAAFQPGPINELLCRA